MAVGCDGRLPGPAWLQPLSRACKGPADDVGRSLTPMLYCGAHTLCTSGIQVTGSHNPKDYNGFKMVLAGRAIWWRRNPGAAPNHEG